MKRYKTPIVAEMLGVSYWRLVGLLRAGRIDPPAKDTSGDYLWRPADVRAAKRALEEATAIAE
jgi:hypothetical protein